MKIAVISDLHLGRCPLADQFQHVEEAFLRFLDRLESRFDRIVLNGDVYQTDHGRWHGGREEELHAARERWRRLVERFDQAPYTYIAGNHDLVAVKELGAPLSVDWQVDDLRLHFTHGHLYDPILAHVPGFARFVSWLAGWAERLGMRRAIETLEKLDPTRHAVLSSDVPGGALARAAVDRLASRAADVVVMGHTHRPAVLATPFGHYLNSGSCSRARLSWLEIDTARRLFLHHRE